MNKQLDMFPAPTLSIAQTLPADVVSALYYSLAEIDPPRRKHHEPPMPFLIMDFGEPHLAPPWSSLPFRERANDSASAICARATIKDSSLGWIVLAHVCSRWRAVGLDLPQLWGNILFVFPKAVHDVLARSRDAPLAFDFDTIPLTDPHLSAITSPSIFTDLLQRYIQRAAVVTFPPRFLCGTSILQGRQLSYLRILHVHSAPSQEDQIESRPISAVLHAPVLTQAVFKTTFVPFVAPALQYLELDRLSVKIEQSVLLDILCSSTRIENLVLSQATSSARFDSSGPVDPIQLPRLATVRFNEPPLSLTFLRHVVIPKSAEFRLFVRYNLDDDGSVLPLLDIIASRLCDPSIDHLRLNFEYTLNICLASSQSSGEPATRTALKIPLNAMPHDHALGTQAAFLSRLLVRMDPGKIRLLHIDFDHQEDQDFTYTEIVNAMLPLSALTTLSVSYIDEHFQSIVNMFTDREAVAAALFDRLVTLIVYCDDYHSILDHLDGMYEVNLRKRWDRIISIVKRRSAVGRTLPRLILRGVHVEAEWLGAPVKDMNTSSCQDIAKLVGELVDEREVRVFEVRVLSDDEAAS
ncbi:hypothetical protein PENSPDRAFT_751671 [Peniophora sp. CONT]|nr:hypothetical protein PENSPDRAFT_751671 [Peniophora sp. CONT]